MSVRTCQFCGKPLSRIWTGGGDYCSREHRNQHRLRLGMDRLVEANKVASLMRRRENLKPITGLHPLIAAVLENRSMAAVKIAPAHGPMTTFRPSAAALRMPRIVPPATNGAAGLAGQTHMLVGLNGKAGNAEPRPWRGQVRVRSKSVVVMPLRRVQSAVKLARASTVAPPACAIPPETEHRIARILRRAGRAPAVVRLPRRFTAAAASPFHQPCHPRPLLAGAIAGMELRVSKSQGFRLPLLRTRKTTIPLRGRGHLLWDAVPCSLEVAYTAAPATPTTAPLRPAAREPRLPGFRSPASRAGNNWPVVRPLRGALVCEAMPGDLRVEQAPWNTTPPDSSLRCEWYQTEPRINLGYAEEPRRAANADGAKNASAGVTRLQENFDSGCNNWAGGVADWRLDAAGARTGSLALYAPSLELIDYDMEFLVRVESRTATWVFRAADISNYYRVTLRVTPEGGYELTRSAVIDGQAEPAVSAPIATSSKTRTALAVRTSVKDNTFSVFVDGQAVDQWTDGRLPAGGIGFGEAPDDRARLYWVRLTFSEGLALKDVKR